MGTIKLLIGLLAIVAVVLALFQVAPPIMANYGFQDDLKTIALMDGTNALKTDEDVRNDVLRKAREHELPINGKQVTVIAENNSRENVYIQSATLNGKPLDRDLGTALARPVRCANDANCLAVSEATDGAGAGKHVVFAVILGTGCGGGIAVDGRVHSGSNGVAGEWGHNTLPWMRPEEYPGPACYCGRNGCLETWISGTGLEADYKRATGDDLKGREIIARSSAGEPAAVAAFDRLEDRLARGLAQLINLLDPDVIVIGGGASQIPRLYQDVPGRLREYVFGKEADTPILPAKHGDASGVRGAAWLWPF